MIKITHNNLIYPIRVTQLNKNALRNKSKMHKKMKLNKILATKPIELMLDKSIKIKQM